MTTNNIKSKQELKKIGTYIRNKWNVFLTRQDDDVLKRAILKTTSSKNKCPNEKHMERLLLYTYDLGTAIMDYYRNHQCNNHGYSTRKSLQETNAAIIDQLQKRLHTHEWTVVLKTLIVFHRLMKDGSATFQSEISVHISVFTVSKMKDLSDAFYGRSLHRFIQRYAMALEERVKVSNLISKEAGSFCNIDDLMKWKYYALRKGRNVVAIVGYLFSELETIIKLPLYPKTIDNPVVVLAWMFLAQDAKRLIHLISDSIMYLIDRAAELSKEEQDSLILAVERYNESISQVYGIFATLQSVSPVFGEAVRLRKVPIETLRGAFRTEPQHE